MPEHVVLMTACIDPGTGPFRVQRSDPCIRLRDSQEALRFWLGLRDARISRVVFVDNSGYPLESLRQIATHENPSALPVEFMRVRCSPYPAHVHYGSAELEMLDKAVGNSALMADDCYFIKANGRLKFPDISRLMDRLPGDYSFAVDGRWTWSRLGKRGTPYITTQLMLFSRPFYRENVLGRGAELMNETGHLEVFFYNALIPFQSTPGAVLRWPVNVPPVGHAAHWHKSYDTPRQRVANLGRAAMRRLAPGWWL